MQTSFNTPLVAIVTPIYNGEAFLAETMASVQALDYPNLVHVVLDNASTDRTAEIIRTFENGRVPLITTRNASTIPIADNWNTAIRMIPPEAQYFHLLCADDTFKPNAISIEVAIAEQDPQIAWVGCLRKAEGRFCGEEVPKDRQVFVGQELMRTYLRREHSAFAGMFALIRTSKIDPAEDFYDGVYVAGFDVDANMRVALTNKVGFVHEELVYWREHEEQITSQVQRGRHIMFDWFVILDRYGPYVLGHKDYLDCRRRYRLHYLRKLLLVRFKERDKEVFDWHMKSLRARDDEASLWDFADALWDWVTAAVMGRRSDVGNPQRPAFGAPVLYPKMSRRAG